MANEKYSFIVVKYAGADTAQAALATVHDLAKEKVVKLKDAVAITIEPESIIFQTTR